MEMETAEDIYCKRTWPSGEVAGAVMLVNKLARVFSHESVPLLLAENESIRLCQTSLHRESNATHAAGKSENVPIDVCVSTRATGTAWTSTIASNSFVKIRP